MAHNLEFRSNGEAMMAWAGETPWHGLGKQVPPDLDTDDFLKAAGLDWTVSKYPTYATINGENRPTGEYHLFRDNDGKQLTCVSGKWHECQNKEAFDFFQEFVREGDMEMHTAGSLDEGRLVWALAKIKDDFTVFGKDRVESHLLFTNPHKYGWSVDIRFTPIRVVCNNTLTLALNGKGAKADLSVQVSHRKKFDPDIVKKTLGISRQTMKDYKSLAEFLGSKRYTSENIIQYFKDVFPASGDRKDDPTVVSQPAQTAFEALETQPGAHFAEGTWWQAANACTYVCDHILGREDASRLKSAWYGQGRARKLKALALAKEYAEEAA